jgi:hypothetical protein
MITRRLSFDDNGFTFLMLNMIGHDPIHDFGQPTDRWVAVQQQIDQIKPFLLSNSNEAENSENNENNENNENRNKGLKRGNERYSESVVDRISPKRRRGGSTSIQYNNHTFNEPLIDKPLINNYFNKSIGKDLKFSRKPVSTFPPVVVVPNMNIYDVISYARDNEFDMSIIGDYIEDIKCRATMNIFINHLNNKEIYDKQVVFESLYTTCYKVFIDINKRDYNNLFITSNLLHDHILNCFLTYIDENNKGILVFDAAMDFENIRIRYAFIDDNLKFGNLSNTSILNDSTTEEVLISTWEIMNSFFQMGVFINLQGKKVSGGAIDDNTYTSLGNDIKKARLILDFQEAVFSDESNNNVFDYRVQEIRNSVYEYVKASKGISSTSKTKVSLTDIHSIYIKKRVYDIDETQKSRLSDIMKTQKAMIIDLYSDMFKKLDLDKNTLKRIPMVLDFISGKLLNTRSFTPELGMSINNQLTQLLQKEILIRKRYNEKIRKDKREEEKHLLALSSGKLTPDNKATVNKFISFVAKSTLYLTGCCDENGGIINYKNKINSNTRAVRDFETECLRTIAGRDGIKNGNYWEPGIVRSQDIDERLFKYFKDPENLYVDENNSVNENNLKLNTKYKYVVNNAANIGNYFRDTYAFCPYTSILDGMPQCSWGTSTENNIERGDMNFTISSTNDIKSFYNGSLKVIDENHVNIKIDILFSKCRIVNLEELEMNSKTLVAHVVLKKTLNSVIKYMDDSRNSLSGNRYLYAEKDIFEKLFQNGVEEVNIVTDMNNQISSHPNSIFTAVFKNLLFKGVGDIFQEINVIAKFGGYIGSNYFCGSEIDKYIFTSQGNVKRCFVAKDRVSVCRYLFIKKFGKNEEKNLMTNGGYIDGKNNDSNVMSGYIELRQVGRGGGGGGVSPGILQTNGGSVARNIVGKNVKINKITRKIRTNENNCTINLNMSNKTKKNRNITINIFSQ